MIKPNQIRHRQKHVYVQGIRIFSNLSIALKSRYPFQFKHFLILFTISEVRQNNNLKKPSAKCLQRMQCIAKEMEDDWFWANNTIKVKMVAYDDNNKILF